MSNRRRIKRSAGPRMITLPPDVERIVDEVSARDRVYFEQHPEASSYVRPYVPGELLGQPVPPGTLIRVHQIRPGVRLREPLFPAPVQGAA